MGGRGQSQNPETVDFQISLLIIWLFEVGTCVFAMLKTVRLEGGLHECSFNQSINQSMMMMMMIIIIMLISFISVSSLLAGHTRPTNRGH